MGRYRIYVGCLPSTKPVCKSAKDLGISSRSTQRPCQTYNKTDRERAFVADQLALLLFSNMGNGNFGGKEGGLRVARLCGTDDGSQMGFTLLCSPERETWEAAFLRARRCWCCKTNIAPVPCGYGCAEACLGDPNKSFGKSMRHFSSLFLFNFFFQLLGMAS